MEISTRKNKVMVHHWKWAKAENWLNCVQLEEVQSFKYLDTTMTNDGSCVEDVHQRITAATMARLNRIWDSKSISIFTKLRLYKSNHAVWLPRVHRWYISFICSQLVQNNPRNEVIGRTEPNLCAEKCISCTFNRFLKQQERRHVSSMISIKFANNVIVHNFTLQSLPFNSPPPYLNILQIIQSYLAIRLKNHRGSTMEISSWNKFCSF